MARNADAFTMSIIAEIFAAFPGRFRFTSGWRTVAQNQAVGGVPNSYHVTGKAADFVAINGQYPTDERERIRSIVASHGYELLFHNVGSGYHYHIEPAPTGGSVTVIENINDIDLDANPDDADAETFDSEANYLLYGAGFLLLVLLIRD